MQATSHRYADCTRGCDGSLEVSGFLWVGRGGGKEQAPDAICFLFLSFLLFGSGWAVCAVARWVNSISTIAWRAIPSPRDEGIFSRTLANRAPLAERSSYPRRRPAPLDQCRTPLPIGDDAEGDGDDGLAASPDGPQNSKRGRQLPTKLLGQVQKDSGIRGQSGKQRRPSIKGWTLSGSAENPPKGEDCSSAGMARYSRHQDGVRTQERRHKLHRSGRADSIGSRVPA